MYDRVKPPVELAKHMDQTTFKKSQDYGRDKIRYSLFKTIFDQVLNWGMIKLGAFPWAWEKAGTALWLFGLSSERVVSSQTAGVPTNLSDHSLRHLGNYPYRPFRPP